MEEKDKLLILQDLCARLPYGVKCQFEDTIRIIDGESSPFYDYVFSPIHLEIFMRYNNFYIKPYLRPMSSMTEEETVEYCDLQDKFLLSSQYPVTDGHALFDWLNKKMFDYRGLIDKDLAIEVTEDNNPYKD